MLGKNWKFKDLDFSDDAQIVMQREFGYSFPLQQQGADLATRTQSEENANYHGGVLSHSLYGLRYVNFSGVGIGKTKTERGVVLDMLQKSLSLVPGTDENEYFDLFWETDDGKKRNVKAKVSQSVKTSHSLANYQFEYDFQLACPSEKVYGIETHQQEIVVGFFGGSPLGQTLSFPIGNFGGGGIITNEGNWNAPLKIQVIGKATNPKIYNATNGQTLRLQAITQNLIYDNRNLEMEVGKERIVEDLGQDITKSRQTGKDIVLTPGDNHIVVITDDRSEKPTIIVTWRDTFNF